MALTKMTEARKAVLEGLIESQGKKSPIGKRAKAVLLSAAGTDFATLSEKVEMGANEVRGALRSWQDADHQLSVAEARGKRELAAAIKELFDKSDDDCCCGCEGEDEESGLDREELEALALKVFQLLNYELRVERERIGYYT